jgi:protease-4
MENRNLSRDSIETIIDNMEGRTAERALASGLIDAFYYQDEIDSLMHHRLGLKEKKKVKYVTLDKYSQVAKMPKDPKTKDKIAVVVAEGEIQYGTQTAGTVSDAKYLKILSKIRQDDDIKAVVLRVNSPGGSAFTSDIIWREIEKIKEKGIPVIASFGDYAASGGYYISAGADKIIAQPNTLTGSIGVFSIFPDATKLVNDKMGINFDTVKTDEFATGLTPFIQLSEREKELLQESTLEIYDLFLDRVSKGRKLSLDSTKVIARGRVWTGRKAMEIGLVDELGDLQDAIRTAAEMAGMDTYKQVFYPTIKEDFLAKILQEINKNDKDEGALIQLNTMEKKLWQKYHQLKSILQYNEPQARLPFIFEAD